MSTNISTTFVTCPNFSDRTLGIKLPFLVMIIKNVRRAPQRLARRSALPPEHSRRARTAARLRCTATHARCSATSRRFLFSPSFHSLTCALFSRHSRRQLKKYFTFEVQVLDDKNVRRRFRASNYQSTTRVKPFICTMPMRLDEGWNQIQFNLSDFTRRAYGTNYIETLRVQIHANCRIRRIYFSDRLYSEEELPPEFKLFLPIQKQAPA